MRAARNYMYRAIFPGSAGKGAVSQAVDPFFFLQRVSAFPRCRKKNGLTARHQRVSAFPSATGHAGADARTLKRPKASSPADAGERYSAPMKSFLPMPTPQWRRIEYVDVQWKYTFGVTYSSRYCSPG